MTGIICHFEKPPMNVSVVFFCPGRRDVGGRAGGNTLIGNSRVKKAVFNY
jgi:hypothetical protein